jgi:hypothetical protein
VNAPPAVLHSLQVYDERVCFSGITLVAKRIIVSRHRWSPRVASAPNETLTSPMPTRG